MNSCRKSLSQKKKKKKKKKKGVTHILGIHDTGVGNFFIMFKSKNFKKMGWGTFLLCLNQDDKL